MPLWVHLSNGGCGDATAVFSVLGKVFEPGAGHSVKNAIFVYILKYRNIMEFEGTVYRIMPVTKGTSARGDWQRQDVVFDMNDGSFTRKICVTFFNKPDEVARLHEGATYQVSVNIESREYNGRWYTDIRAWRIQPKQEAPAAAPMPDMPPIGEEPSYAAAPAAEADDLPF